MDRIHLWEWEDQVWMPAVFRNFITDNLHFMAGFMGLFQPMTDKLYQAMQTCGETRILDLCSGGGGPVPALAQRFQHQYGFTPQVTLTDLYPNEEAFARLERDSGGAIRGERRSISAFDVPAELPGFRTLFTGFHHFRPAQAHRILADAVAKRRGIAVFEAQERRFPTVLLVPLAVFFTSLLFTPFAGRMSWRRFLFTYLIPICPLVYAWDGFVSCLRTYSPRELRRLVSDLETPDYRFEIGQLQAHGPFRFPYRITYLLGLPQRPA